MSENYPPEGSVLDPEASNAARAATLFIQAIGGDHPWLPQVAGTGSVYLKHNGVQVRFADHPMNQDDIGLRQEGSNFWDVRVPSKRWTKKAEERVEGAAAEVFEYLDGTGDLLATVPVGEDGPVDLLGKVLKEREGMYAVYEVGIQFNDIVFGGTPKRLDYALARVAAHARAKKLPQEIVDSAVADVRERYADAHRAKEDTGSETIDPETGEAIDGLEAAAKSAWNTFHIDPESGAIYLECRTFKAMVKSALSQLGIFVNDRGSKSAHDLGFYVLPDKLFFYRDGEIIMEPDGYRDMPAVVSGPDGKRATISRADYVDSPQMRVQIKLIRNAKLTEKHIIRALALCGDVGLGAKRSQSFGQFEVTRFARIKG